MSRHSQARAGGKKLGRRVYNHSREETPVLTRGNGLYSQKHRKLSHKNIALSERSLATACEEPAMAYVSRVTETM